MHLHHDSDEVAYILSGEITFKIGDQITVGGPGTSAFMPRDIPHAWKSTGAEPGRVLFLYTPGPGRRPVRGDGWSYRRFADLRRRRVRPDRGTARLGNRRPAAVLSAPGVVAAWRAGGWADRAGGGRG
jgi:uncharacterized cupin superfamily protein